MPQDNYFIFGDIISNTLAGLTAALLVYWLIDESWPVVIAMPVAMFLGMVIAMMMALLVFARFFGAMEVMLPVMVSGMLAAMIAGMRLSMGNISVVDVCIYGILIGLLVNCLCWAVNSKLQGKQHG